MVVCVWGCLMDFCGGGGGFKGGDVGWSRDIRTNNDQLLSLLTIDIKHIFFFNQTPEFLS